jgi:hypothetical protein
MNDEDFVGSEMLEKKITNRKVSVSGDKINWLQTRQSSCGVHRNR